MFMNWINVRLTPACEGMFGKYKTIILALNNVPHLRGYDEVRGIESNSMTHNKTLSKGHGVKGIRVEWTGGDCQVRTVFTAQTFEVSRPGKTLPRPISAGGNGVGKEEVAFAIWICFQVYHPEKFRETTYSYMKERGGRLSGLTPSYVATFHSIKMFWQQGEQYVGLPHETGHSSRLFGTNSQGMMRRSSVLLTDGWLQGS